MKNDFKNIREEFKRSEESRYIHRLHGVLLVLSGLSTVKVGKLLGDPQRTVAHWTIRFREQGLKGLQVEKTGPRETLSPTQKKALWDALAKPPKKSGMDGDKWTGVLVSLFMHKNCKIELAARHCNRLLAAFKESNKRIT